jgi:putative nucleotidyltransferase with HDIG domain
MEMSQQRRGRWFDPAMVDALLTVRHDQPFWDSLRRDDLAEQLSQWEPQDAILRADEACLDQIAEAFAMVVDAKSPWTFQHSSRVAQIAVGVAGQLDCCEEVQRDIRRAALLHDLGKLGVSNVILDKPGKPTADEFAQIRKHPEYTQRILERVEAFERLADVAAGHHERLDGRGYHLGRQGDEVPWISRILAVADIFEALTANRPYRAAMQIDQVREILIAEQGKGLDPECVQALLRWHDGALFSQRVDAQLAEVERLVSGL